MTAKVGSLNVDLTLETARFQKGLSDARRGLSGAQKDMSGLGSTLGGLGKAMAGVGAVFAGSAIVGSLKDMAMQGLAFASSLGETAQQLGVTTKELQEYRYAATQAGLEQSEMDQALAKLTRSLGEAGKGSKAQADAFAKLNINVRDAKGNLISAGDAIPKIAEALKGISDPAERATLLVDLFGKSGQKLEPLLAGGAAGVNSLRDAAQRLGIVLSDKQIQSADETADKLAALQQVLQARIAGAVADNTDSIIALAEALISLVTAAGKAVQAMRQFNLDRRIFENDLNATIYGMSPLASDQSKAFGYRYNAAKAREEKAGSLPNAGRASEKAVGDLLNKKGLTIGSILGKPTTGGKANYSGSTTSFRSSFQKGIDAAGTGTDNWYEQGRRLAIEIGMDSGIGEKIVSDMEKMADKAETTKVEVVRSFKDMADGTISALQNLSSSIRGGGFLDILGAVIGLATQLASIGVFGKKAATNVNKVPAYANGTNFHPGGLALVGERGPELLHLPRGSAVTPNNRMGPMQVQVIPSPYFDVRVNQNIDAAAPAIASAGGAVGQRRMAYRQSRRLA